MIRLFLIRHPQILLSQKTASTDNICYGQSDLPLLTSFYNQKKLSRDIDHLIHNITRHHYKNAPFIILSSPLQRCAEFARSFHEQFFNRANVKLITANTYKQSSHSSISLEQGIYFDERLMEFDFGSWELHTWSHIEQTYYKDFQNWMADPENQSATDGESYLRLRYRVLRSYKIWNSLICGIPAKNVNVLVFSHAGVIRCLLSFFLQFSFLEAMSVPVAYARAMQLSFAKPTSALCQNDIDFMHPTSKT